MADILVGIVILLLGVAVSFLGLRMFFVLLPLWGFIAGFFLGAGLIHAIFGDGFLGTVGGWIAGVVVGALLSGVSYAFWYVGALIAAASSGALIGSGLMALFGVDTGWVVFIVAAIVGALFVATSLMLNLPVYVVLVNTAIGGATAAVAGILLIFNQIDREDMGWGAARAIIDESFFWFLVWVVVAVAGIVAQMRWIERITLPIRRWVSLQAAMAAR